MNPQTEIEFIVDTALIETTPGTEAWKENVRFSISKGVITQIDYDCPPTESSRSIAGIAIPAMVNTHSHAFQRGFAGMSEFRTESRDSFWTWRNLMYKFVSDLTPEDVYIIARQLYLEMVVAGYSWVGEFHYLHNSPSGNPYANPTEMADALLRAAGEAGIGINLLPVLYQRSGFSAEATNHGQRRFGLSLDQYFGLVDNCCEKITDNPDAALGLAFHSLRAVSSEAMQEVLQYRTNHLVDCSVHIHVAEQQLEVDDCLLATGKRPLQFLFDSFPIDESWCLIHATHMDNDEIARLSSSRAVAGLCPTTEANLGDGFFPASQFLGSGGRISVGSDSHCSVNLREELRWLEYGQRLLGGQRAALGTPQFSTGRRLYSECAQSGGQAIGIKTGRLAVGCRADLLILSPDHPTISHASKDRILDRFIFLNTGCPIQQRMLGGRWIEERQLTEQLLRSRVAFNQLNQKFFKCP
ncbi:MAG: formimidoylglutamate deiminase [Mariniblastus sp.]|nr:formimidoylglutamate deiminase [Mariniblastus sp.]